MSFPQVDPVSKLSPLMIAAKTNSKEAIDWLLAKAANPNYFDSKKYTALSYAILSENIEIVKKLLVITTEHLDLSLQLLANSLIKLDQPLRKILNKVITTSEELYLPFLINCSEFGKYDCYQMLVEDHKELFEKIDLATIKTIINNIIVSDVFEACRIASLFFTPEQRNLATEYAKVRDKAKMVKLLCGQDILEESKSEKTSEVFQKVIKCEEFPLFNNLSIIIGHWLTMRDDESIWIKLTELLEVMKAPDVHYHANCPENCSQKRTCLRVEDSRQVVLNIMNVVGESVPVFGDPEVHFVGSMKEKTKEVSRLFKEIYA